MRTVSRVDFLSQHNYVVLMTRAEYLDTTIILNEADPTFKDTLGLNEAESSGFSSSDSGKTWAVDTISIHAHTFDVTS